MESLGEHMDGFDDLLEDEATLTEENGDEPSIARRKIFTDKLDPPIESLFIKHKRGDLILDPIFQRRPVWDLVRQSKLIESVILEVPIPVFYLAESQDGTEEVIDGQQRFRSFFDYLDGKFSLRGLKAIPEINGKKFTELEKPMQKLIENYSVRIVTFKKESDENLRFEIFERLNTGAMPLNAQELRNCVYRGNYNQLLIDLSEDLEYRDLMGLVGPERRMKDVEYVLRFASFFHYTYLKYKPSMARFLNEDMRKYQHISQNDISELSKAFKQTMSVIRSLLGKNAFHRFYRGEEGKINGYWEQQRFNASLYDVLTWGFTRYDKNALMSNLDSIREAWISLMSNDENFIESIERSTSSLKYVTYRFEAWQKVLKEVMANTTKQPRCFTRKLKLELYNKKSTCALCGQDIVDVDDAAVDHIKQYWLGGETIPENARLAHRYCNWARPKVENQTVEDPSDANYAIGLNN